MFDSMNQSESAATSRIQQLLHRLLKLQPPYSTRDVLVNKVINTLKGRVDAEEEVAIKLSTVELLEGATYCPSIDSIAISAMKNSKVDKSELEPFVAKILALPQVRCVLASTHLVNRAN